MFFLEECCIPEGGESKMQTNARKIRNAAVCAEETIATWDQCLTIPSAFPGMRQTLIPQNNQ